MALAHHYRILGLRTGASFDHVKLAYRNLARLYHPDVNPGDQLAKEKFIQVTQAYQALVDALPASAAATKRSAPASTRGARAQATATAQPAAAKKPEPAVPPQPAPAPPAVDITFTVSPIPGGTEADQQLKVNSYKQLREFLGGQRFPRAVALVEGLAQRFAEDPEVRQWHAIAYYRWGHDLLNQGNLPKAEVCLKKARRVDPHNKSLRQALLHDFQQLEQLRQASAS
jgi:tetratricopeptide (TPR) repeat protein